MPNDTASESSRRDVSNADLLGTDTIPTVGISTMKQSTPRGVIYSVVPVDGMAVARRISYFVIVTANN